MLIVTVPAGPMSKFDKFIGHKRHYNRNLLRSSLHNAGFRNIEIRRSGFPAINLTRFFCIIMGNRLIKLLQRRDFGSTGCSGLMVAVLRYFFKIARSDTFLGWQLISLSVKKLMPKIKL